MSSSNLPQQEKSPNLWKWFGIGCGGCLLTSILAIAGLGYFIHKNLQLSTDSQQAVELAQSIFNYEIPGGSRGILTFKFMDIEFAQIANKNAPLEVLMLVGEFPEEYVSERQVIEQIKEAFARNQNSNFTIESQKISDKELCDRPVQVLVQQGQLTFEGETKDPKSASSYTAKVNYNNTIRFVWLVATGEESNEKASQVFASLECK